MSEDKAVVYNSGRMNRREFILAFGALPTLTGVGQVRFCQNPFKLGMASGDPAPSGIVLWTRLDGAGDARVPVRWVAEDESSGGSPRKDRAWH